jgi:hypothetical protein
MNIGSLLWKVKLRTISGGISVVKGGGVKGGGVKGGGVKVFHCGAVNEESP